MSNILRFKVLLTGSAAVGKTSILNRFVHNKYQGNYTTTIGVDFLSKVLNIDEFECRLTIWDLAGQERYNFMRRNFYGGSHGVMFIFDLTRAETFENIENWYSEMKEYVKEDIAMLLIGNKSDLTVDLGRAVDLETIMEYTEKRGFLYYETSAKTGDQVERSFLELTRLMVSYRQ